MKTQSYLNQAAIMSCFKVDLCTSIKLNDLLAIMLLNITLLQAAGSKFVATAQTG